MDLRFVLINDWDGDDVINWVRMPQTLEWYWDEYYNEGQERFYQEYVVAAAIQTTEAAPYCFDFPEVDFLCAISGGTAWNDPALGENQREYGNVGGRAFHGDVVGYPNGSLKGVITIRERFHHFHYAFRNAGRAQYGELYINIGLFVHELGHAVMGMRDYHGRNGAPGYAEDYGQAGYFTSMHTGEWAGRMNNRGECPTQFNAVEKKGLTFDDGLQTISETTLDLRIPYDSEVCQGFVVEPVTFQQLETSFVLENRHYEDFNRFLPGWFEDGNNHWRLINGGNPAAYNPTSNLLLWQCGLDGYESAYTFLQLADRCWESTRDDQDGDDVFPGPGPTLFRDYGPGLSSIWNTRLSHRIIYNRIPGQEFIGPERLQQTGFALKNVRLAEDDEVILCDVYTNYFGGRITEFEDYTLTAKNLYLGQNCEIIGDVEIIPDNNLQSNNVNLDGDIIVTDGGRLYIHGNAEHGEFGQIRVNLNGYTITVYAGEMHGRLDIDGDVVIRGPGWIIIRDGGRGRFRGGLARVRFTSSEAEPAQGDWQGILIEDLESSFAIENVDIEYAVDGIKAVDCGSYLELDDVIVTDFQSTGFNLVNSSPTISNCSASDSEPSGSLTPVGLYCYNSSPYVTGSNFNNNYKGVQVVGLSSVLTMGYCSMNDNASPGLDIYDAVGYLYNTDGFDYGYNVIIGNGSSGGVYAGGLAAGYMGGGANASGNNSIYDNTSYEIYNTTVNEIQAEYNWWGSSIGPTNIYGLVDYDPWLLTAPGSAPPKPGGGGGFIADDEDEANDILSRADSLVAEGRLADALELYSEIVEDYQNTTRLLTAVRQMRYCYKWLDRRGDWRSLLQDLNQNRDIQADCRPFIAGLLAHNNIEQDEPRDALNLIQTVLRGMESDDEGYSTLLFQLGMTQHYNLDNPRESAGTFRRFIELFGREHPLYRAANMEYEASLRDAEEINSPPAPPEEEETETPTDFALFKPYPNPFNSTINIDFALPEDSFIKLTIHDMQGREIAALYNGTETAGFHSVSWDATGFASGVYFCKLQSEGQTRTVKLAMIR